MLSTKKIIIAIVSLILGCLVYLLFRQDIVAIYWIGNPEWIKSFGINITTENNSFTYCLLYCLPDALWFFSLLVLQFQFHDNSIILSNILLYSTIALPFVLETLQYCNIIDGTFDILDIVFYLITLVIVLKIEYHEKKQKN